MSRESIIHRNRHVFLYGISLAALLFLLNWLKLRLVIVDHAFEVYVGLIAIIFTALGIWLAAKLMRPKVRTLVVEKEVPAKGGDFRMNRHALEELNLSKRELDVLQLMAKGLSNQEIADNLFVSVSTVKTHSNNLFDKMGVKRRTQAVEKGREAGIIP
jgi:NarL family two-component system response regulator LiaR